MKMVKYTHSQNLYPILSMSLEFPSKLLRVQKKSYKSRSNWESLALFISMLKDGNKEITFASGKMLWSKCRPFDQRAVCLSSFKRIIKIISLETAHHDECHRAADL